MQTIKKIEIPKPCYQAWNDMQPVESGRYCSNCAKIVTDFTVMNNQQIIEFIARREAEKICGRFKRSQLLEINPLNQMQPKQLVFWKRWAVAASLLLCSMPYHKAEAKSHPFTIMQPVKSLNTDEPIPTDSVTFITITGTIIDRDDKQPIQGVIIRTIDRKIQTMTDNQGNFKIIVPSNVKRVEALLIGYETQTIKIKPKKIKNGHLNIQMKMDEIVLGGLA